MYLYARKYMSGGYDFQRHHAAENPGSPEAEAVAAFDRIIEEVGLGTFEQARARFREMNSMNVEVQVAYWRKANAIHAWFVREVQSGVDDCRDYYVPLLKLVELRDTCQRIQETIVRGEGIQKPTGFGSGSYTEYPDLTFDRSLARDLLPTQSGFFFGGTDYDQWYAQSVEETVGMLTAILDHPALDNESWDFLYRSSW